MEHVVAMVPIVHKRGIKGGRTMKKIYPTLTVLSIFFLLTGLVLAQQAGSHQQPTSTQGQARLQTFEGELAKVDAVAKKLWVTGSDGKEMEFGYNEQTQIIGAEGSVE